MSLLAEKTQRPGLAPHTDSVATFVPDQSRAERTRSYAVADFPMPTGREEDWRFTPVDRIRPLLKDEATGLCLDWSETLPAGVRLGTMSVADWQEPVRLTLTGDDGQLVHGHVLIRAGRFSKATVVVAHAGHAAYSELVTISAGDGAHLTVVSLQEWDDRSIHLGQHDVVVGRDAQVKHIAVTLGGAIVRLNTNATYAGPGGSFEAYGVYFADAGQHLEHRLFVDHAVPHCTSNVEYKGALQGDSARTVWVGDVLIRAAAEGTDTYELNRNLLLTDGARADSIPNLEIETGEIAGAGHASATGRFDDQQLFYLMARGIPEAEARRLVVRGFFAAVVSRIGVPEVIGHLMSAIDAELEASVAVAS